MKTTNSEPSEKPEESSKEINGLELLLGKIGRSGTNFVGRLEKAKKIDISKPEDKKNTDKILSDLDELAKKAPSEPYSALALQGNTIHVVQNKDAVKSEDRESLLNDDSFKKLKKNNPDLEIKLYTYDRATGDHPDTVAIAKALESGSPDIPIYLGLAAFERGVIKGQQPASCGGCTAAINALNDSGYMISVSLSTPMNFPSNTNYTIPNFIKQNTSLMDSYLLHVEKSLIRLQKEIAPQQHKDLYTQYMTRDTMKQAMLMPDVYERKDYIEKAKEQAKSNYDSKIAVKQFEQKLSSFSKAIEDAREIIPNLRSLQEVTRLKEELTRESNEFNSKLVKNRITSENILQIPSEIIKRTEEVESLKQAKSELKKEATKIENRLQNIKDYESKIQHLQKAVDIAKENLANFEKKQSEKPQVKGSKKGVKESDKSRRDALEQQKLKQQYGQQVKVAGKELEEEREKLNKRNPLKDNEKSDLNHKLREVNEKLNELTKKEEQANKAISILNDIRTSESLIKDINNMLPRHDRIGTTKLTISQTLDELPSQPLKKPKTEVPDKWYEDRHFSLTSTTAVGSAEQLKINLERLNPGDTLALNVHVLTGDFGGLSHWVGIKKGAVGEVNTFAYIDPTGLGVHKHIEQAIKDQNPAAEIKHVFDEKVKLQHGKIVGSGDRAYFNGNDKDCGPFVVYSLQKLNDAPNIEDGIKQLQTKAREISNIDDSQAFGQELRKGQETALSKLNKEAETEKPVVPEKKEKKVDLQGPDKQNDSIQSSAQTLLMNDKIEILQGMSQDKVKKIVENQKSTIGSDSPSQLTNKRPSVTPLVKKSNNPSISK